MLGRGQGDREEMIYECEELHACRKKTFSGFCVNRLKTSDKKRAPQSVELFSV